MTPVQYRGKSGIGNVIIHGSCLPGLKRLCHVVRIISVKGGMRVRHDKLKSEKGRKDQPAERCIRILNFTFPENFGKTNASGFPAAQNSRRDPDQIRADKKTHQKRKIPACCPDQNREPDPFEQREDRKISPKNNQRKPPFVCGKKTDRKKSGQDRQHAGSNQKHNKFNQCIHKEEFTPLPGKCRCTPFIAYANI